jgi:two-component system, NtrC family, response regulator
MTKGKVLIIDDEEKLRQLLSRIIELEDYQVYQAGSGREGLKTLEQEKDVLLVVVDVKLPDIHGLQLLSRIKKDHPLCEVLLLTAYGTIHDGVEAMKLGAFDYLTKGDDNDQILVTVERAVEKARMKRRILDLENKLEVRYNFEKISGKSLLISEAIDLAKKVAVTDLSVLLQGETGSGKELFAQSIHNASSRKNHPFVAVNCSAFPKELLESEVFGYKKGAFTGAVSDKKGLFEEAHTGTLFLDEIGEMGFDLQARLLRFLEEKQFMRLGDSIPRKVDVRVIAASNRDLTKECEAGRFRPDLYYRLAAFNILIPPLRSRKEDIPELARYFMTYYSAQIKKKITEMDPGFMSKLMNNPWPGNVRELKNAIERAIILADGEVLTVNLLPELNVRQGNREAVGHESMNEVEKDHIRQMLLFTKGNKTLAAKRLGIGLTTLYRKIQMYNLE